MVVGEQSAHKDMLAGDGMANLLKGGGGDD